MSLRIGEVSLKRLLGKYGICESWRYCKCSAAKLYSTLCNPLNWGLPGFSLFGSSQARILEGVAISSSRGSSTQGSNPGGSNGSPALQADSSLTEPWGSPLWSFSSVQFSGSVVSNSLRAHELQQARPTCPSPTPGVHPNSCPSSRWCHPTISSSVAPSPPAPNPSQNQSLFQWVNSSHEVAKVLEFQL